MPSRLGWKKAVLLAIVSLAHAGLLYSFSAGQSKPRLTVAASNKNPYVIVQASISLLKKENLFRFTLQLFLPASFCILATFLVLNSLFQSVFLKIMEIGYEYAN